MFPIPFNFPFRKRNGDITTIADAISSGGGSSEIPTHTSDDAGKVLTVTDDGSLEWNDTGVGGGAYVGSDVPSSDLGSNGDYYYKRSTSMPVINSYVVNGTSNKKIVGSKYTINKPITITKIRAYTRSAFTAKFKIGNASETLETSPNINFTANAWTEYTLATPINATTNDVIQVAIDNGSNFVDVGTCSNIFGVINDVASWTAGTYGGFPAGSTDTVKNLIDFSFSTGYELVENQYVKASGSWVQIM